MRSLIIITIPVFFSSAVIAQQIYTSAASSWMGYYNILHINEKWSINSDAQVRSRNWLNQWSQILFRAGVACQMSPSIAISTGIAWFNNAIYHGDAYIFKNEFRLWQEFSQQLRVNPITISNRVRAEERFIQQSNLLTKFSVYDYLYRLRDKIAMVVPLRRNRMAIEMGDEIMINPSFWNSTDFFDTNRAFVGVFCNINPSTKIQCQYMFQRQSKNKSLLMDDQHILRLNIHHELFLKRK